MKTIQLDYKNIEPFKEKLSLCLGYFDGIHIGHQKLVSEASKNSKYKVGLLTFNVPVSSFIDNGKAKEVISSLDDRFKILSRFNIDYYFVMHIDKDFLNMSSEQFISLLEKFGVKELFIGEDYRFGKMAKGNPQDLSKHFDTHVVSLLNEGNKKISTESIIKHIKNGELEESKVLLGRNYMISGIVSKGNGIGHTIGFPTMNLKTPVDYVLPKYGVYKTIAYLDNIPHISLTNVGIKPTINGDTPTIEVHIPGFKDDAYGRNLSIEFIEFIRPEIKFSSLEELKKQISEDIKKVL